MRIPSVAKISTPRLFGVVARPRVFACLDENRGRPLVWFDSPPGAGKTSVLASYLEVRGIPTLWYQVDPGDADPANVFHYLTLAEQAFRSPGATALPRLMTEHLSDLPSFARKFFRQLFSRLPENAVIVFDNYQEAPGDAAMHEIVRMAATQVPPGSSIYCASRVDAPPLFSQLAASGAMFALHWDALRLTFEETREIAAAREVRDDWLVRALHQQSEGWAAGITLMLERLGHTGSDASLLPTDTRESVFNYFATLIFDQASEESRHILRSVGFLPYVTASMAAALSDEGNAGQLLEQLYRRRLFIDRRPGATPIYQFHALFRDFIQMCAREQLGEVEVDRLLHRTAQVLEANDDVESAMDLRIVARDWDGVVRTILQSANTLLGDGRRQTLVRWIKASPLAVGETQPWVIYWLGVAEAQTEPLRGIVTLRDALSRFERIGEVRGQILCLTALLNSAFVGHFALDSMDGWLDALLGKLPDLRSIAPSPDLELRVWGVLCSTLCYIRPWHPWTAIAAERVDAMLVDGVDPGIALGAACSAMALSEISGHLDTGNRIAAKTAPMMDQPGASPSAAIWWLYQKAYLCFDQARYEESLELLHRARHLAQSNGMQATFASVLMCQFMVEFRVMGWAVANATLKEVESMDRPSYPMADTLMLVYRARSAQFRGAPEEAADLAGLAHAAVLRTGSYHIESLFGLIDAELLIDASRFEKAAPLISRSRELIERTPVFDHYRAGLVFTEAFLAHAEGNATLALVRLRESLTLAKEGNRRYPLRYLECAMPKLFGLALEHGIEVEFVQQIIRMFRLKPHAGAPDLWPWPIRIHVMGRFEILVDDKPLEFSRKVPKKTLALLKVLIAYGGQNVPEQAICDALWVDEEADAAHEALGITVLRLRKLLGSSDAITQQGGKLSLNGPSCWVDAFRFEQRVARATAADALEALKLYGGSFLPEHEGEPWSVAARERLRGKFIHLLATYGASLEAQGDTASAISLYFRGLDADPIVEVFHQGLMRCYQSQGRHTEAISVFRRLRPTLSAVLGVAPSPESCRLYESSMITCGEGAQTGDSAKIVPLPRRRSN